MPELYTKGKEFNIMKKKITSLILILTLALTMTLGGGAGFAAAATQSEITSAFNQ